MSKEKETTAPNITINSPHDNNDIPTNPTFRGVFSLTFRERQIITVICYLKKKGTTASWQQQATIPDPQTPMNPNSWSATFTFTPESGVPYHGVAVLMQDALPATVDAV